MCWMYHKTSAFILLLIVVHGRNGGGIAFASGESFKDVIAGSDVNANLMALVRESDERLQNKFDSSSHSSSSCACYKVYNPFMSGQPVCLCRNVCLVKERLYFLQSMSCENTSEVVAKGPLQHIPCNDKALFGEFIKRIEKESLRYEWQTKESNWLDSRQKITWRTGLTYFQPLFRDATNVAHLIGKVMSVLLVNNCTVESLIPQVDRIVFQRAEDVVSRMQDNGPDGFHASLFSAVVGVALAPVLSRDLLQSSEISGKKLCESSTAAFGRVEFESALAGATEEEPICFERVALSGLIRAITFIGGPHVSHNFSRQLFHMLNLDRNISKERVRVVWLRRVGVQGRRAFTPEALATMRKLLAEMDFEVREVDFAKMTFKEQILHTVEADILFSIHGAGLTIPSSFGRSRAVVVEIMPYFADHTMYFMKALTSGITYMKYQCHRGEPQRGDNLFEGLTMKQCLQRSADCKRHFLHTRKMNLTKEDFSGIKRLLGLAKEFVLKARVSTKTGSRYLKKLFKENCQKMHPVENCRQSLIRSPLVDLRKACVLEYECGNV